MNTSSGASPGEPLKAKPTDTSPSHFLPHLKEFNIDHGKYKHYGHSMTAQQLDNIIHPESAERRKRLSKSSDSSSYSNHLTSPLESPTEHISKELDLPSKLYSEAVISQMLSLRIEQEKTRQIAEKSELGRVVASLLKDAEAHGFGGALIRRLFLDEDCDEFRHHVERMRGTVMGKSVSEGGQRSQITGEIQHHSMGQSMSQSSSQMSQNVTQNIPHNIKSGHVSPRSLHTPSPNKSPSSEMPHSVPNSGAETLASSAANSHSGETRLLPSLVPKRELPANFEKSSDSRKASDAVPPPRGHTPPMHLVQPIYPMYYQIPPEHFVQTRRQSRNGHANDGSESGSPRFQHQYVGGVYQSSPYPENHESSHHTSHKSHQSAPGQPQSRPVFYVNSSPPGAAPMMPSQYYAPPPLTANMGLVPWPTPQSAPEKRRENDEEPHAHKKPRAAKNGISFMISTPKNPPARKYNKPSGTQ